MTKNVVLKFINKIFSHCLPFQAINAGVNWARIAYFESDIVAGNTLLKICLQVVGRPATTLRDDGYIVSSIKSNKRHSIMNLANVANNNFSIKYHSRNEQLNVVYV